MEPNLMIDSYISHDALTSSEVSHGIVYPKVKFDRTLRNKSISGFMNKEPFTEEEIRSDERLASILSK